jgi:hypothetical protein
MFILPDYAASAYMKSWQLEITSIWTDQNESELADYKNNAGSHCNCANQDRHGHHVTLVFPVNHVTGGATATEKRMQILLSTIRARPFDGLKHPLILACRQLAVKH